MINLLLISLPLSLHYRIIAKVFFKIDFFLVSLVRMQEGVEDAMHSLDQFFVRVDHCRLVWNFGVLELECVSCNQLSLDVAYLLLLLPNDLAQLVYY